jgi:hypothetical protein
MNWQYWLEILAIPVAIVVFSALSFILKQLSTYLQAATTSAQAVTINAETNTHNALLARIVDGMSRIAGTIATVLSALPAGSNVATARNVLIKEGVAAIRQRYPDTVDKLGSSDVLLTSMIAGELGKLTAAPVAVPKPVEVVEEVTFGVPRESRPPADLPPPTRVVS